MVTLVSSWTGIRFLFVGNYRVESTPVKLETSHTLILPHTVIALCPSLLCSVWPDLSKFRQFGKSLPVIGKFLVDYFLFGKMPKQLWQICDIIGLIFIVAIGQMLKNNLPIWSHLARQIVDLGCNCFAMVL